MFLQPELRKPEAIMPNIYETLTSFVLPLIERQLLITLCARHHARSSQAPHACTTIPNPEIVPQSQEQVAALRPTAMSLIPDTALFLFPTGPHALAVHWPQAGAGIWNCRAVPLGYMVPFRKLSFHFQFPFFFLPAQRGCGGGEQVGTCFKV